MAKFKIGDLIDFGPTSFGKERLVLRVTRLTKTQAVCEHGRLVERVSNSTGKIHGRAVGLAKMWDGRERQPLRYPEIMEAK